MKIERLWNRRFVQLICIEGCLQMGGFLTRSINANYAVEMGASMTLAGFIAGLMATAALMFRPFCGAISDRLSKKSLLVVSCFLFAIAAFGCAVFQNLVALGICLAIQGFAFAFKSAIVISFVPLIVPERYVGTGVGWMGLAYTIAIALGPAIGLGIADALGYPATYIVSGAVLAAALALAVLFKDPVDATEDAAGSQMGNKDESWSRGASASSKRSALSRLFYLPVIPLSIIGGILMIAQGVVSSFILLTGEMRGLETVSLYFVFYSVANLGARPLAGRASDEWGVQKIAPPMMIVAALGMVALAFMDSTPGVAIGGVCMGLGQGSAYAAIQAESVRGVPTQSLGRAANTYFIGPDLAMGLGPIAGGAVLESFGPAAMFLFCAACISVALVLFVFWGMRASAIDRSHE